MLSRLRLLPVEVEFPKKVANEFKKAAKAVFPHETLAYLIGQDAGTSVSIERLWFPEDVASHAGSSTRTCEKYVMVEDFWLSQAQEFAKEFDAQVVGDIHSHPYEYDPLRSHVPTDCAPGEEDFASEWFGLGAICRVTQLKSGRLVSSIRVWGPMVPVTVKVV